MITIDGKSHCFVVYNVKMTNSKAVLNRNKNPFLSSIIDGEMALRRPNAPDGPSTEQCVTTQTVENKRK